VPNHLVAGVSQTKVKRPRFRVWTSAPGADQQVVQTAPSRFEVCESAVERLQEKRPNPSADLPAQERVIGREKVSTVFRHMNHHSPRAVREALIGELVCRFNCRRGFRPLRAPALLAAEMDKSIGEEMMGRAHGIERVRLVLCVDRERLRRHSRRRQS
jgi:hypothetical protein